ncbi:TetR family transcriptional regulator [Streptomyces sp. NPDC058221]|uniref:TetR family transcriptional regulator n=1 Tax=Streptomyces sp. NPDC058221 TaxID=3346388 RepID=UPI0036E24010
MHTSTLAADRLRASLACCDMYIERASTALTVGEVAQGIGISQRTFHRYFPTKAETILPMFGALSEELNQHFDVPVGPALRELMMEGYRVMYGYERSQFTQRLFPLVVTDKDMWAVFLRAFHDGEVALVPHLAPHLGVAAGHPRARAAAAAFASSNRIAFDRMVQLGEDHESAFDEQLDAFGLY